MKLVFLFAMQYVTRRIITHETTEGNIYSVEFKEWPGGGDIPPTGVL